MPINVWSNQFDSKKEYESIQREELFLAMSEFGILAKLISLSWITLHNIKCAIKTSENPFRDVWNKN